MTASVPSLLAEVAGWTALAALAVATLFGAVVVADVVRQVAAVAGD